MSGIIPTVSRRFSVIVNNFHQLLILNFETTLTLQNRRLIRSDPTYFLMTIVYYNFLPFALQYGYIRKIKNLIFS